MPVLTFDPNDSEVAFFVKTATRYYQLYDVSTGTMIEQSPELQLLGLQFTADEIRQFNEGPMLTDVQTDEGRLRFYNDRLIAPSGHVFLMQVGTSLESRHVALDRFVRLALWLIPLGLIVTGASGWFVAGWALKPVQNIARAARQVEVSQLNQRLPIQGSGDDLDQLALTFNETLGRLEHAVGEMKQFTGSIAHELRTPLAALSGEAEIALLHGKTEEDFRRVLASQLEEFQKLTRIINQLLTFARADSGELHLQRTRLSVVPILSRLVDTLTPLAADKGVLLMLESAPDITVVGDREWLERAILNLLDNAIKYTPANGQVTLSATVDPSHATIAVKDTGAGIPEEALPHVFERFYRADPARAKSIDGVGLGLSLVKWIVDQHGGTIQVESSQDKGTCFTIRLPQH